MLVPVEIEIYLVILPHNPYIEGQTEDTKTTMYFVQHFVSSFLLCYVVINELPNLTTNHKKKKQR